MQIEVDPVWGVFRGAETFDSFKENFVFKFKSEGLPKDVHKRLSVIQKVLEYSYFKYDFIDIAFVQLLILLEKCTKGKYELVERLPSKKKTFHQLIEWLDEKGYFQNRDKQIVNFLREYRNEQVHDAKFQAGGLILFKMIKKVASLIEYISNSSDALGKK